MLARAMWIGDYNDKLPRKMPFYPHTECGGEYSPHVRVIRKLWQDGTPVVPVELIGEMPCFGVLSFAAQNCQRDGPFDRELLLACM